MKIPFDIKFRPQIERGEYKVETYDRHPVRIICWNKNTGGLDRIVALVAGGSGQEKTLHYTEEGWCVASGGNKNKDLFIITSVPELSEFEKGYMRIVHKMKPEDFNDEGLKIAKEEAAELFELAKDEIYSHESLVEYAKKEKEEGKAEALKDLPRWRKADVHCFVGPSIMYDEHGFYIGTITKPRCRYITYESLNKLPGFNE